MRADASKVETASCPVCRSVNHAGVPRCLNCGAPMEVPVLPEGVSLDDLPPAPAPGAGSYGFTAMVQPAAAPSRSATWSIAVVLGLVSVLTFFVSLVMILGSEAVTLPTGSIAILLTVSWIASVVFWLWMLIEAITDSRVGWALLIFFFGVIPAFCYALFGRRVRTASF